MQQVGSQPQTHEVIYPGADLSPVESLVIVYGLDLALLVAVILVGLMQWARYRWRARTWRSTLRESEPLAEGDTVLRGTVEHAAGSAVAVRVGRRLGTSTGTSTGT